MVKRIVINARDGGECRIAQVEDGHLQEYFVDRPSQLKYVGNVYRGVVSNTESGIQAAFVDVGQKKNAFLHVSDILSAYQSDVNLQDLYGTKPVEIVAVEDIDFEVKQEVDIEDDRPQSSKKEKRQEENQQDKKTARSSDPKSSQDKESTELEEDPKPKASSSEASETTEEEEASDTPLEQEETDKRQKNPAQRKKRRAKKKAAQKSEENAEPEAEQEKPAPKEEDPKEELPVKRASPQKKAKASRKKTARKKTQAQDNVQEASADDESGKKKKKRTKKKSAAKSQKKSTKKKSSATKRRATPASKASREDGVKEEEQPSAKPQQEHEGAPGLPGNKPARFYRTPLPDVQNLLKRGQEILVQVTKAALGGKGPSLTTYISLPGRYMVLMPNTSKCGISRKIRDFRIRQELRTALRRLRIPQGMGVIIRTAAANRPIEELQRDLNYLLKLWNEILQDINAGSPAPACVYRDGDPAIRVVRDYFTPDIDEIVIDSKAVYERVLSFFKDLMPDYADRVKLSRSSLPLFIRYGLEPQVQRIFDKKVLLPSGGYLFIEQTEALIAIDVNSGRFTSEKSTEATAFKTNMEAIPEIARQLRLRDLGGIIIGDFIDMNDHRNRKRVEEKLKKELEKDRARIKFAPTSSFGLIEMTRQRIRPSIRSYTYQTCSTCGGFGHIENFETQALFLLRVLRFILSREESFGASVQARAEVLSHLHSFFRSDIEALSKTYPEKPITFEWSPELKISELKLFSLNSRGDRTLFHYEKEVDRFLSDQQRAFLNPSSSRQRRKTKRNSNHTQAGNQEKNTNNESKAKRFKKEEKPQKNNVQNASSDQNQKEENQEPLKSQKEPERSSRTNRRSSRRRRQAAGNKKKPEGLRETTAVQQSDQVDSKEQAIVSEGQVPQKQAEMFQNAEGQNQPQENSQQADSLKDEKETSSQAKKKRSPLGRTRKKTRRTQASSTLSNENKNAPAQEKQEQKTLKQEPAKEAENAKKEARKQASPRTRKKTSKKKTSKKPHESEAKE